MPQNVNGSLGDRYLADVRSEFARLKAQAERALAQVSDAQLQTTLDPESNSLAILIQHVAGNMISRWTDFLGSDGEKPDRNRDGEFEAHDGRDRAALMALWERGWSCLFGALGSLGPDDLLRTVTIRGEAFFAIEAIQRQLSHYAAHIGQMVFLAKHLAGERWRTLSIPRGASNQQQWSYRGPEPR